MIFSNKCPKCGNTSIAGPHRVHGGDRHIKIDLPGIPTATLESYTCVGCGYTEFYADRRGIENIKSSGRFLSDASQSLLNTSYNMKCRTCGSSLSSETTFCPQCGSEIKSSSF